MKNYLILTFLCFTCITSFAQKDTLNIVVNDSTTLTLVREKFDKTQHEIVYWDSTEQAVSSIDGKPVYGTDASLPNTQLVFAEMQLNSQRVGLETKGMFDPWLDGNTEIACKVEQTLGNPLRLRCLFSIGAGTYLVEWTIIEQSSFLTMITSDWSVLDAISFDD